ncbi:MAG: aminodeoxychorismate/anthranilate synthase component II [Cytophagales bacterium]|nr:MAG: aminodeoxychorismate/anthranilate synthase component II [Cytophagales bacterium]TAF61900.1 MAG: aminodeoxychorismate/anthranilate synthase component II [Cytophagales bacterium]
MNQSAQHILLLDNLDSFTYNLYDYFCRTGLKCSVWRHHAPPEAAQEFDAIVLSPGPGRPRDAGQLMRYVEYFHLQKPLLGICLGHQAIGEFFGAELVHAIKPMHGKVSEISCSQAPIFEGTPEIQSVVRYHSLVLNHLPPTLLSIASTRDGENMAFKHVHLPIYGLQFHPEAVLTEFGLKIIDNWRKTLPTQKPCD